MKRKLYLLKTKSWIDPDDISIRLIGVFTSKKALKKYFEASIKAINDSGSIDKVIYDEKEGHHRLQVSMLDKRVEWFIEEGDILNKAFTDNGVETKVTYL